MKRTTAAQITLALALVQAILAIPVRPSYAAACGLTCNYDETRTGTWLIAVDPAGTGRVACARYRLRLEMNRTSRRLPNWRLTSRNHTYQGHYPHCYRDLGQPAKAAHTRAYGYYDDGTGGGSMEYVITPLEGNKALAPTVESSKDIGRYIPEGYWYATGHFDWTAWGKYHHYVSPPTPVGFFCRTDLHSCN